MVPPPNQSESANRADATADKATAGGRKLVIVESPTKSKKIQQYLPKGFTVDSCVGHIRDLPSSKADIPAAIKGKPWADYGVDVEHGFTPYYVTIPGKQKVITGLKAKLKAADELYLATDEDREGESISWHLVEALKPKVPVRRMVFNEITKDAIQRALAAPRDIDMDLVQAQETRRILDRLYGYALSPLLWKKVGGGLSAGRVQSPAIRLVVLRERERRAFVPASYWGLTALLQPQAAQGDDGRFEARLVSVSGQRVATGKDFDKDTGKLAAGKDALQLGETQAKDLQQRLEAKSTTWTVTDVTEQQRQSSPEAPFVTSTLQQEANNRLNLSARQAMQAAQRLFENGFITYMRTDSTALSEEGLAGARDAVKAQFGSEYLHPEKRTYEGKQQKGAQEAHEAIRPAGRDFVRPEATGLSGVDLALYRLIWMRTLACQMANERYTSTTVTITALEAQFTATGKRVDFAGYRAAYGVAETKTDGEPGEDGTLPNLVKGDQPACRSVTAEGHETKPPARYTEASLVKALVEERIGRPSTYAAILQTIQDRGYVVPKGKALVPSFTAFAVVGLMERHFPKLIDLQFTADMEEKLDLIAAGDLPWVPFLEEFFRGPDGLQAEIERQMEAIDPADARTVDLGKGFPYTVKIGRFGPYIETERDGERVSASIPESVTPDELDAETVERLLRQKAEGPKSLGEDPASGLPVFILDGRFGPYYQLGEAQEGKGAPKPKRASLPKGKTPDQASLEEGLFLLSLPKELGPHPDGGRVLVGLGRFGPYVLWENGDAKEYRSIKPDQLTTVGLAEAMELLSKPKQGRGGRGQATVLRELGAHPDDGKPVNILDGRYGPYIKHGDVNANVPKGTAVEAVTMDVAVAAIAERAARGPPKKKARRRKA